MGYRIRSGKLTGAQISDVAKLIEDATTIWDDGEPEGVTTFKNLRSRLGKIDRDLSVLHRAYIDALNDERGSAERWGLSFLTMMRCQTCGAELVWYSESEGHRCPRCPAEVGTRR
jgi:FPC/CPF motif-containing protein YcgG